MHRSRWAENDKRVCSDNFPPRTKKYNKYISVSRNKKYIENKRNLDRKIKIIYYN